MATSQASVVKGHGYEPILSKKTMLDLNLIKILDCDRDPRINVLKTGKDPLLEEYANVFEGREACSTPTKVIICFHDRACAEEAGGNDS